MSEFGENDNILPFEEDEPEPSREALMLELDGFEGPIDLLLTLARDQKVDLTKISILELANQYLAYIERARELRLEVAADYLVMAAWLAYLKSRLLLPQSNEADEPSASEMAERLAFQLQRLEAMRNVSAKLFERPRRGRDFHIRGEPEAFQVHRRPVYDVSLFELLRAYADYQQRMSASHLEISASELYSMEQALERLRELIGRTPDWATLSSFLPGGFTSNLVSRSALAATFAASLELVRTGHAVVRQSQTFGPIFLRAQREGDARADDLG